MRTLLHRGIIAVALCLMVSACGSSDVDLVKDGTMGGFESTTIGKAFGASFDSPKWEAKETEKGQKYVEFTGTISEDLHNTYQKAFIASVIEYCRSGGANDEAAYSIIISRLENLSEEEMKSLKDKYMAKTGFDEDQIWKQTEFTKSVAEVCLSKEWPIGEPVLIQWTINNDGESFELSHVEANSWVGGDVDTILAVIYM